MPRERAPKDRVHIRMRRVKGSVNAPWHGSCCRRYIGRALGFMPRREDRVRLHRIRRQAGTWKQETGRHMETRDRPAHGNKREAGTRQQETRRHMETRDRPAHGNKRQAGTWKQKGKERCQLQKSLSIARWGGSPST